MLSAFASFLLLLATYAGWPIYGQPSAALWEDQLFVAVNTGYFYRGTFTPTKRRVRDPIANVNPRWWDIRSSQAKLEIRDDRLLLLQGGGGHYIFPLAEVPLLESSEFAERLLRWRGYQDHTSFIDSYVHSDHRLLFPEHRKADVVITGWAGEFPEATYIERGRYSIQIESPKTVRLFHAYKDKLFVSIEPEYTVYVEDQEAQHAINPPPAPDRQLRTGKLPKDFTERFAAYTAGKRDYLVTTNGKVYMCLPKGKSEVEVSAVWNDPKRKIVGVVQDLANDAVYGWGFATDNRSPERFFVKMEPKPVAVPYKLTVPLQKEDSDAYLESYECARAFRKAMTDDVANATAYAERLGGKVVRDNKLPGKPVVELDFSNRPITDADIKGIAALKSLTTLNLLNTNVTDKGLQELAAFKNLTTLRLGFTRVTDEGLKDLAELQNLTTLYLTGMPITDAGVKNVAALKSLTTLALSGKGVTNAGIKELAALKNLTMLYLHSVNITDAGLKELAPLKKLFALALNSTPITDVGVKELTALKNLTELYLSDTKVTDVGVKELAPLKNLSVLELDSTQVTDQMLMVLRDIDRLHTLHMELVRGWRTLPRPKGTRSREPAGISSRELHLTKITDAGLPVVAKLTRLESLTLRGSKITDAGLKELVALKNLTQLKLCTTVVSDAGLKHLARLPQLSELVLSGSRVTDAGLKELAPLKNLVVLALSGTEVTDAGLKTLAGYKQLALLFLRETKVTEVGVKELQKALPNCEIFK